MNKNPVKTQSKLSNLWFLWFYKRLHLQLENKFIMPATPKQRKIAIMGYRLDDIKDLNFRIGIKTKVQVCPLAFSIKLFLFKNIKLREHILSLVVVSFFLGVILSIKSMPNFWKKRHIPFLSGIYQFFVWWIYYSH